MLDSSRYFVLRIEHQGRHAFVGLGFNEVCNFCNSVVSFMFCAKRNNAFDFNVALTDHKKDLEREVEVAKLKQAASLEPQMDFSFKEGEKITINVQARTADGQEAKRSGRRAAQSGSSTGGILPPPPSAKTSIRLRSLCSHHVCSNVGLQWCEERKWQCGSFCSFSTAGSATKPVCRRRLPSQR